jgi:hypothetical protein
VFGAALLGSGSFAQQKSLKDQLVGTWMLTSVTAERADGSKAEPFGNDPRGIIVFTPEGYFSLLQSRRELPKIAANDRAKATADEANAVVDGSIAYYGTYSVNEADKTIAVKNRAKHVRESDGRAGAEADHHISHRR